MGETREERIRPFLEENETPVIRLREGAMLRMERGSLVLHGVVDARLFRRGGEPIVLEAGASINLAYRPTVQEKRAACSALSPESERPCLGQQFPEAAAERGSAHAVTAR